MCIYIYIYIYVKLLVGVVISLPEPRDVRRDARRLRAARGAVDSLIVDVA